MKNKILILVAASVVLLFTIISCSVFFLVDIPTANKTIAESDNIKMVGNDRDEHGCIGSAGYSWCEIKQKCLRPWEEACEVKQTVPQGYTLDSYQVAEILDMACVQDSDCVTPGNYAMRSNCPYTSLCLNNKCTVVCPDHNKISNLEYENAQYGFGVLLPNSWSGYSIVTESWTGNMIDESKTSAISGPKILIRHPLWTTEKPYQDIPVMIFTLSQWNLIEQEKLSVSAAPIGPSELGHNANYIFALPARYNYAFPEGFEEVEKIIENKSFKAW